MSGLIYKQKKEKEKEKGEREGERDRQRKRFKKISVNVVERDVEGGNQAVHIERQKRTGVCPQSGHQRRL